MVEALIAGERDPRRLADLARGRMKAKRSDLITALDGRFDDHHGELAWLLLSQIDALTAKIGALSARIERLIDAMDESDPHTGDPADRAAPSRRQPASEQPRWVRPPPPRSAWTATPPRWSRPCG